MTLRLAVLSTGRQDWGILRSTCQAVAADPAFDLRLILGGMHVSRRFGMTSRHVEAEGYAVNEQLAWLDDEADTPAADQASDSLRQVAHGLSRQEPDALLLAGDRLETIAAAIAATLLKVPIVHLHGGEETAGAFDNAFRHAISKLSHLHLVSHTAYAARLVALGEDPASIHVVGAPGLDNMLRADLDRRDTLEQALGIALQSPVVIVTLHPATLAEDAQSEVGALTAAMDQVEATYIITLPNSDPGNAAIREALQRAARQPRRVAVEALGERRFWSLMRVADAMVGNSSSAIIEAPSFGLPAVNIGSRQEGRIRGQNVVDVPADPNLIVAGLREVLSPAFRGRARAARSPYGEGGSAERIVHILREWTPPHPPVKPPIAVDVG